MIFIRAQALDNTSEDLCVLDGELMDAASAVASPGMALLSETVRNGREFTESAYRITSGPRGVAVKIPTDRIDTLNRRAGAVAVFSRDHLNDLHGTAASIAEGAGKLGRPVAADHLGAALTSCATREKP